MDSMLGIYYYYLSSYCDYYQTTITDVVIMICYTMVIVLWFERGCNIRVYDIPGMSITAIYMFILIWMYSGWTCEQACWQRYWLLTTTRLLTKLGKALRELAMTSGWVCEDYLPGSG